MNQAGSTAFARVGEKVGQKGQAPPRRIPDVETQLCPQGGTHVLTNNAKAETSCVTCGASWADLDAIARQGRKAASA